MKPTIASLADMRSRLARYLRLVPNPEQKVDSRITGHQRELMSVIGHGVAENPLNTTSIIDADHFHVTYIRAEPDNGASLHAHETVEVFITLIGNWTVYWNEGADGEQLELAAYDCISFPPGVMRGYYNSGPESGLMLNIVGGVDPGKVVWSKSVLSEAETTGLTLDSNGMLVVEDTV